MGPGAEVRSTRYLADFSAALATFHAVANDALAGVDREIRRTAEWLEEQRQNWTRVVRKLEEDFHRARSELARRRMMRIGEQKVSTSDQELAFAKAKARLEWAEGKLKKTKEWERMLPEMVLDHQAPVKVLQNALDVEVPRMRAFLEQKIRELEQYAREAP